MNIVIIANIISFVGAVIMILIGFIKKKDHILIAQCIQCGIMGVGNIMLGGVSGLITNLVTIVRNLCAFKFKFNIWWKIGFIALQIAVVVPFNTQGWIGYLPVAAAILFTIFMDTKSAVKLKIVIIITQLLWLYYDIHNVNYSAAVFDALSVITNGVGIFILERQKKQLERGTKAEETTAEGNTGERN